MNQVIKNNLSKKNKKKMTIKKIKKQFNKQKIL